MATNITTPSKVCSMGSQYSVSDDVTVPNPTPLTEALDSEVVDPPPPIDFVAMSKTLATIAESLNESAEEAMLPSPPINTPVITSPAASIVSRYPYARSRGLSTIGDRLARMDIEGHKFAHHGSDMMSASGHSIRSSTPADDSDYLSDMLSDGDRGKYNIPIALGSPRINPGIEGVISFTSNDLSDKVPVPFNSTNPTKVADITAIGTGSHKPKSQISLLSTDTQDTDKTGVTEMSIWKEDVEGFFERALQRLENLAHDEHLLDPSKTAEHYYEAHLKRLLGVGNRKIPVSVNLMDSARDV